MSPIQGTKTEQNLLKAFAGESQASSRYTDAAFQAAKEGHEHVAAFFEEIAKQEKIHAEQFAACLETEPHEIPTAHSAAGSTLSTEENLRAAITGEHEEWKNVYPEFARIAKEEGFIDISQLFINIASVEKQHEKRYLGFLQSLTDGTKYQWRCRNCGFISSTPTAPHVCSICKMPREWFEIFADD